MTITRERIRYQRWLRLLYLRPGGAIRHEWWGGVSRGPEDDDRVYAKEVGYLLHDWPGATVLRIDVVRVRADGGGVSPHVDPDIIGRYVPGPHVHPIDPYPHLTAGV